MEYSEVTAFINKAKKFGSRLDLTRIKKLCALLGNPQTKSRFVHIAGTNGKGSTSVFIENILMQAGYKTGLFTSPFLYHFNERIQVDNTPISDNDLLFVMEQVVCATEQMLSEGFEHPTEFELITAAAFLYFAKAQCDVVVLEVGLGGVLDSTNVIEAPLVSVLTSISYDHMEYLGNTLTEIAKNKCGIIKKGCPVVSYPHQDAAVLSVIEKTAKEQESSLVVVDDKTLIIEEIGFLGNRFFYNGAQYETTMIGEYQIYNAITAINAVEALVRQGFQITCLHIQNGLKAAKWPARFDVLHTSPMIIADGSHNADGMRAFVATAKKCLGNKKAICVFGMLKDKTYDACLSQLREVAGTIIVTEVDSPRKETAENLALAAKPYFSKVYACANNHEAMQKAISLSAPGDVIFSLGSLYMMKNIKEAVEDIFGENC